MKGKSFVLLVGMLSLFACQQTDERKIRASVEALLAAYPASTLQDLYKSFFQDRFGPGHLIADTARAAAYLREELSEMKPAEGYASAYYYPTGYEGHFYRVDLAVIAEGYVPFDVFFDVFLRSASAVKTVSPEAWQREWQKIYQVIAGMDLSLPGFEKDSVAIFERLAEGEYVVHHSQLFTDTYHVHYRIMEKHLFEREILPLLPRR